MPILQFKFRASNPVRRQFEFREFKSRRDGASRQRPVAAASGGLPCLRRNDRLRHFARGEIGTKSNAAPIIAIGDMQGQCAAGVIVPDLDRVDAMPMRSSMARQQEIDRGRQRASAGVERGSRNVSRKWPPSGCGASEPRDDLGSGIRRDHQDLFLRSRNSPNTSAALAPFIRTPAATEARRAQEHIGFLFVAERHGIVG